MPQNVRYTTAYQGQVQLQLPHLVKDASNDQNRANLNAIQNWANNQGPSILRWISIRSAGDGNLYISSATTYTLIDPNGLFLVFVAPPSGCVRCTLHCRVGATNTTSYPEMGFIVNPGVNNSFSVPGQFTTGGFLGLTNILPNVASPLVLSGYITGLKPGFSYSALPYWFVYAGGGGSIFITSGPNFGAVHFEVEAVPAMGN